MFQRAAVCPVNFPEGLIAGTNYVYAAIFRGAKAQSAKQVEFMRRVFAAAQALDAESSQIGAGTKNNFLDICVSWGIDDFSFYQNHASGSIAADESRSVVFSNFVVKIIPENGNLESAFLTLVEATQPTLTPELS